MNVSVLKNAFSETRISLLSNHLFILRKHRTTLKSFILFYKWNDHRNLKIWKQ